MTDLVPKAKMNPSKFLRSSGLMTGYSGFGAAYYHTKPNMNTTRQLRANLFSSLQRGLRGETKHGDETDHLLPDLLGEGLGELEERSLGARGLESLDERLGEGVGVAPATWMHTHTHITTTQAGRKTHEEDRREGKVGQLEDSKIARFPRASLRTDSERAGRTWSR